MKIRSGEVGLVAFGEAPTVTIQERAPRTSRAGGGVAGSGYRGYFLARRLCTSPTSRRIASSSIPTWTCFLWHWQIDREGKLFLCNPPTYSTQFLYKISQMWDVLQTSAKYCDFRQISRISGIPRNSGENTIRWTIPFFILWIPSKLEIIDVGELIPTSYIIRKKLLNLLK